MSYRYDRPENSGRGLSGQTVNTLTEAPNGDLHLLVTFEILSADSRTNQGDLTEASSIDSVMRPDSSAGAASEPAFTEAVDVESLVSYLGLDFVEHDLFADRFLPDGDDVVYTSRGVGTYQLLCVYHTGKGLLLVVDDDEAIRPLVGCARNLLTET